MRPVLDGTHEAGPVYPVNARCDGRQLSLAAPVAETLAGRGDILPERWESGPRRKTQKPGRQLQTTPEGGADSWLI